MEFFFRFLSISLHRKSVSKKFDIWPKAESSTLALGHKFASLWTLNKRFFYFNECCLLIKWKIGVRTTLFMQNYLFNILVQSNLRTICTFSFRQKTAVLISSGLGPGLCFFWVILRSLTIIAIKKFFIVF